MEKLDLNSELLQPMKEQLEIIINRLMNVCATKEWIEPKLEYQISEKIKEIKNTSKGLLGNDYEMKVSKETNEVYVQKINEQLSF